MKVSRSSNIVLGGKQTFVKFAEPVPSPNKIF
jgi:CO dehydrogenase/acetyl-CoA synthase delta subunit